MAQRKQREDTRADESTAPDVQADIPDVADPDTQQVEQWDETKARVLIDANAAVQSLVDWLAERATKTDEDEWASMAASVGRILSGQSAEEVLQQDLPISGKQFVNQPFVLHGFTITDTDYSEGPIPWYANMDVTIRGGERRILNCGGAKILAKLKVLDDEGDYPYYLMLSGKETKRGYTVLDLVKPV
jgi:hypothetical protein